MLPDRPPFSPSHRRAPRRRADAAPAAARRRSPPASACSSPCRRRRRPPRPPAAPRRLAAPAGRRAAARRCTTISVKAQGRDRPGPVRATTSTIGKGNQDLRDIPQSVTVVTEKLIEDRRVDTVKEALHYTAGITLHGGRGRRGGHPPARLLAHRERRHLRRRHPRPGVLRPRRLQLRPDRGAARLGLDAVRARLDRRRGQPGQQAAVADRRATRCSAIGRHRRLPARDRRLQLKTSPRRRRCASTR